MPHKDKARRTVRFFVTSWQRLVRFAAYAGTDDRWKKRGRAQAGTVSAYNEGEAGARGAGTDRRITMNAFATITHFPTATAWMGVACPDPTGHQLARCAGRAAASALRAVAFGRSAMLEKRAAQARRFAEAAKTAAPDTPHAGAAQNAAQAAEKALACGRAIAAGDLAAARRIMDSCGSVYVRGALTVALA